MKKFVGSFLGVASVSALIGLPGMAQAHLQQGSSNSFSKSIIAQNTPGTTPSGTMSTPGTTDTTPSGTTSTPGTTDTTPSGTMSTPGTTNSNSSLNALDKEFMTKAAQSDTTEIQTSQLALKKSKDQAVKDFAQQMIQAHTNSTQELTQIAGTKGFTLPKGVGSENKPLLTKLQQTNGKSFDRAYMQGQLQAHTKTLAEYQKYIKQGQDPDLQAFAKKIAPVVAEHKQMAQKTIAKL
ncbi:MAG: DUF4142 domain-containing protein [Rhizonema sp. NSF051]|nr:DUF4142 domain-containing protein [Rhizonema sp. NSF051]